jgi:hypothetical protein
MKRRVAVVLCAIIALSGCAGHAWKPATNAAFDPNPKSLGPDNAACDAWARDNSDTGGIFGIDEHRMVSLAAQCRILLGHAVVSTDDRTTVVTGLLSWFSW